MLASRAVRRTLKASGALTQRRLLSKRAATILAAVDIDQSDWPLPGVYDGRWCGNGEVLESVCPATGEVLARVQAVRRPKHVDLCAMTMCVHVVRRV